jgi:hypothetical protein
MASYEGIPLPKIYEAQMPSVGGGWNILEKIVPTLANAYLRGMQQEEMNQLRADTTMYSAIASSSQHYLEPEPIEELIKSLTVERDSQLASGDTIRANYINASIASMEPWLLTRKKQGEARDLINSMEDNMNAIENTPGYEGGALDLLNDMLDNLNEYEPYFNTRMVKDISNQETELNNRLSVLGILKDLDDNNYEVDDEGNPIDVPGIQLTRDAYPNEESYMKAKQAVDLLQLSIQGQNVNTKLLNRGLSLHNSALNEWGVATSEDLRQKNDLMKASVGNIDQQLWQLSTNFRVPQGEPSDFYLDKVIIDAGLVPDLQKTLNISATGVDSKRLKLIRNYALSNVAKVLTHTTTFMSGLDKTHVDAFKEIQERVKLWTNAGSPVGPQGDLLLDDIEEFLGYWKDNAKITRDNIGKLNFPGSGDKQKNAKKLVLSYMDFLLELEKTSADMHDLWGWDREYKTSSGIGKFNAQISSHLGGNP